MPGNNGSESGRRPPDQIPRWNPVWSAAKRAFDIGFVLLSLPVCLPIALVVAAAIPLDSSGPVIYSTRRVGRRGKTFRLFKFRTMVRDAASIGPGLTFNADTRITRIGRILRRTKFDEFPQAVNVLLGQMSIVGPRPEAPKYVELYTREQRVALEARPGLTSLAQVAHRDEEDLLPAEDTERYYVDVIMPEKLRSDTTYVRNWSIWLDARIFLVGLAALFRLHTLLGLDRMSLDEHAPETQSRPGDMR